MEKVEFREIYSFEKNHNKIKVSEADIQGVRWCSIVEMCTIEGKWLPIKNKVVSIKEEFAEKLLGFVVEAQEIDAYPESKVLGYITKSTKEQLEIGVKVYRGHEFLDVRSMFEGREDRIFRPSKKGLTFPPDVLHDLQKGLEIFLHK